jgi:cytochrome c-type biogenesis protein CcmE
MATGGSKYVRFGAAIAIIVLALGYLAYTGVQQTKSYYVTIGELQGMGNDAFSKRLRVAGNVQPGSIKRNSRALEFTLIEEETPEGKPAPKAPDGNPYTIKVKYVGSEAPPDTFKDDSQALVTGNYGRDQVFHASEIQAKCASKYAPQQGSASSSSAAPTPAKGN